MVGLVYRAHHIFIRTYIHTVFPTYRRIYHGQSPLERTATIIVGHVLGDPDFRDSALYSSDYQRRFRGRQ